MQGWKCFSAQVVFPDKCRPHLDYQLSARCQGKPRGEALQTVPAPGQALASCPRSRTCWRTPSTCWLSTPGVFFFQFVCFCFLIFEDVFTLFERHLDPVTPPCFTECSVFLIELVVMAVLVHSNAFTNHLPNLRLLFLSFSIFFLSVHDKWSVRVY